jgi:hypothetical protein
MKNDEKNAAVRVSKTEPLRWANQAHFRWSEAGHNHPRLHRQPPHPTGPQAAVGQHWGLQHLTRHGLQQGVGQQGIGQQTCTGTSLHTTRGTHRVTVYGTCLATQVTQLIVFS